MKSALIITLGTREISMSPENLKSFFTEEEIKNFSTHNNFLIPRLFGQAVLDKKKDKKLFNHLEFPIIEAGMDFVKKNAGLPDEIFLVATDQEKEIVGERFWKNDSILYAEVLKILIANKYKKEGGYKFVVPKIKDNVAYLDTMYDFFNNAMKKKDWKGLDQLDNIFLLNQGGIDAINTALMLNCLNRFGKRTTLLSVSERIGSCAKLEFSEQYLHEKEILRATAAIKKYRYAFIKNLDVSDDVRTLSAYAEHRLNFDFDEAEKSLLELSKNQRSYRDSLILELNKLRQNEGELLKELYTNASIKFEQEAYVDFLLRVFRIIEGVVNLKVMNHLDFEFDHVRWDRDINSFLSKSENSGLKTHLDNIKIGGRTLDISKPSIPVLLGILAFYEPQKHAKIEKIRSLSQLRNNSIGAHNFKPVSKKLIEKSLQKQGLTIEDMFSILDEVVGKTEPFKALNEKLFQLLKI